MHKLHVPDHRQKRKKPVAEPPQHAPPRRRRTDRVEGVFTTRGLTRRVSIPSPVLFRSAPPPRARDLVTLDAASAPPTDRTRAVIPPGDDREPVTARTALPWCAHVRLVGVRPDSNDLMLGTGWLVDPCTIITAGHCVYKHGYMRQIKVLPAGDAADFPTVYGMHCSAPNDWINEDEDDDVRQAVDVGMVKLAEPIPGVAGVVPYAVLGDGELRQIEPGRLSVAGFPEDSPDDLLVDRGRLREFDPQFLFHNAVTSRGQSGAPVLYWETDESPVAIGIHHFNVKSGADPTNRAVRIGPAGSAWIQDCIRWHRA